ncbi:glycerophosphodiester phosphodiesterase family protein [Halobacteriovorax sp. HLS]|uniref:glycerophosphodiester phosphodiesterase n=1 Tax=Halobacteriovorax sp. HLS TaxID=2234000 RepID=UPI0013E388C9|nr:glycerophosphodiester phosphodiesterase family protein [Halobacteriovorax sp. HLS]
MKFLLILILSSFSISLYAKPKCIAHRGFSAEFPENSSLSIAAAVEMGAEGVEFDIQHTKDGVAILMHDETLERTAESKQGMNCPLLSPIAELEYQEIQNNCQLIGNGEIPRLADTLEYLEDKDLYSFIEFKDVPNDRTLDLIEEFNSQKPQLVRLISFKSKALKKANKRSKTSAFWNDIKIMRVYKWLPISFSKYGIDIYYKTRFMAWIPNFFGKEVGVWTVDSKKDLKKMLKRRIAFITTNRVDTCLSLKN